MSRKRWGNPGTLLQRLSQSVGPRGAVLIGFDFPIGLPSKYAESVRVVDIIRLLPELGGPQWPDFYNVARTREEISLGRPFYPHNSGKKGEHQQSYLINSKTKDYTLLM